MKKRIYIKAYTNVNFGDDLFVKILCERYPHTKFYINCSHIQDKAFENIKNLTIMNRTHFKGLIINNFKKIIRKLRINMNFPYSGQVYIGGSIFIEFTESELQNYYFKNLFNSKQSKNLPYYIVGANFGPYSTPQFIEKHKEFFAKQVSDICMRDYNSYSLFKDIPHVRYAPDIVFTYNMPALSKKNRILISCIYNDGREEIENFNNKDYANKMIELCKYYLSLGKEIFLLSMCNNQKDQVMCYEIKRHFSENVNVIEYNGNLDEILYLFASSDYIIASRFHAMVLGLLSRTPVFPISYSDKTSNVISDLKFKGMHTTIGNFSSFSCKEIDANRLNSYILEIDTITSEAEKQFLKLDKFIKETNQ